MTKENHQVDEHRGWTIWEGYNDTDNRTYYFVCAEDGEDIGTSDSSIDEAKKTIDNAIKSTTMEK